MVHPLLPVSVSLTSPRSAQNNPPPLPAAPNITPIITPSQTPRPGPPPAQDLGPPVPLVTPVPKRVRLLPRIARARATGPRAPGPRRPLRHKRLAIANLPRAAPDIRGLRNGSGFGLGFQLLLLALVLAAEEGHEAEGDDDGGAEDDGDDDAARVQVVDALHAGCPALPADGAEPAVAAADLFELHGAAIGLAWLSVYGAALRVDRRRLVALRVRGPGLLRRRGLVGIVVLPLRDDGRHGRRGRHSPLRRRRRVVSGALPEVVAPGNITQIGEHLGAKRRFLLRATGVNDARLERRGGEPVALGLEAARDEGRVGTGYNAGDLVGVQAEAVGGALEGGGGGQGREREDRVEAHFGGVVLVFAVKALKGTRGLSVRFAAARFEAPVFAGSGVVGVAFALSLGEKSEGMG